MSVEKQEEVCAETVSTASCIPPNENFYLLLLFKTTWRQFAKRSPFSPPPSLPFPSPPQAMVHCNSLFRGFLNSRHSVLTVLTLARSRRTACSFWLSYPRLPSSSPWPVPGLTHWVFICLVEIWHLFFTFLLPRTFCQFFSIKDLRFNWSSDEHFCSRSLQFILSHASYP